MDDVPNEQPEEPEHPKISWRVVLRSILLVYLVTLPACTQNAGHFGPGFFPLLAALLLVPMFAVVASMDAALAWPKAWSERGHVPVAVGMSLVALGYWAIIVFVIAEKT